MKDVEILRQKGKCYSPLKDIKRLQDLVMLHHLYRATTIFFWIRMGGYFISNWYFWIIDRTMQWNSLFQFQMVKPPSSLACSYRKLFKIKKVSSNLWTTLYIVLLFRAHVAIVQFVQVNYFGLFLLIQWYV
jgi:hypothetical protein